MKRIRYEIIEGKYSFRAEDDWGDYYDGKYRKGTMHDRGYRCHWYNCVDGQRHRMYEHIVKWEYFNGKIPEGYEIDHIIPISNGGTNRLSNLRMVTHEENLNNPNSFKNKSESHKGQTAWNKGIPCPDEVRKKISDSKEKKEIVRFKDGNSVEVFSSIREAERLTKTPHNNIQRCCNGGFFSKSRNKWVNVAQAKGYKWMYEEDYEKMINDKK